MLNRLARILTSFSIVLSSYWLYAAIAVPLIEPAEVVVEIDPAKKPPLDDVIVDKQREMLAHWFGPNDWEMDKPKIIETPQGILLINNYRVLPEQSKVELWPCTMIFLPDDKDVTPEDRYRRAVIMRSSPDQRAVLQFEGELDIIHAKIGKLVGGTIRGNVTIYSQQRSPGPEDDLQVHARDIELNDSRITSPHVVDLRWGLNTAQGQRVKINLSPDDKSRGFRGLLSVELQQHVHVHLESVDKGLMPGSNAGGGAAAAKPTGPQFPGVQTSESQSAAAPVEIHSRGPFRFDFEEYTATFQDQVDVVRLGPKGSSEQLNCELLSIFFKKPPKEEASAAAAKSPTAGGPKFEADRVVAFGQPVTVRVPASEVLVRAGQIEYEVASGITHLRDGQEVVLQQGKREVHCRDLYFEPDETRQLGRFLAKGDGWLKGAMPDDPEQHFEASWSRRLHFRPHEKQHVLSLEGNAHVKAIGKGAIDADEIHLWLNEKRTLASDSAATGSDKGKEKVELVPDRLMSVGKVNIDSPQVTGVVSQLQMWFEYGTTTGSLSALVPRHILAQLAPPIVIPKPRTVVPAVSTPPVAAPPNGIPRVGVSSTVPSAPAPEVVAPIAGLTGNRRIHVEGELMRIRARAVGNQGKQMELSEIVIEHDVRVKELQTERPDEQPLQITGKKLHLVQQTANEAVVTVSGQPAHVEGRGVTLDSSEIHLNRLTNAMWTDGAGRMTMLVDRDPDGKLMAQPQRLEVTWQEKLDFSGRVARFHGGVIARQAQQLLRTKLLEVVLSAPLNPTEGVKQRPEVEQISCREGVFLEHPTFEGNRLVSLDRLQAAEMNIHRPTGQLTAIGPGWVKSVRLDNGQTKLPALGGQAAAKAPSTPPPATDPKAEKLSFIGVEFQGALNGNMGRREMVFESAVRTVYGPVQHWEGSLNPDRPQDWGAAGMLMTSDRLSLVQIQGATPEQNSHEMEATGTTIVEGAAYTARASRITYAQAKDLLVIEGNGRSDAELSYQPRPGGASSKVNARKIMFWPTANRVEVGDARFIDLQGIK